MLVFFFSCAARKPTQNNRCSPLPSDVGHTCFETRVHVFLQDCNNSRHILTVLLSQQRVLSPIAVNKAKKDLKTISEFLQCLTTAHN